MRLLQFPGAFGSYAPVNVGAGGGRFIEAPTLPCIHDASLNTRELEATPMSKVKVLLASMLLVFALGAVTAASAYAEEEPAEFVIEGLTEKESEKVEEKSSEDIKPLVLKAAEEPAIECKKDKVVGETVTDDSSDETIKALDFEECSDTSESGCKVKGKSIDTDELEVVLEKGANEKDTKEKFKPKTGKQIAHFELEGLCKETKLEIDGDFTTREEDNEETVKSELPVDVEVEESSGELEYGDTLHRALFHLDLPIHYTRPLGLCRHPLLLMVLCLY